MPYMVDLVSHSVKDQPVGGSMLGEMFAYSAMRGSLEFGQFGVWRVWSLEKRGVRESCKLTVNFGVNISAVR